MLKIDMHAHVLPPSWPDFNEGYGDQGIPVLEAQGGRYRIMRHGRFFREVQPNCFDMALRIGEYARFGVDVQVLSTVPVMFSYRADPRATLALARFFNDHLAETQAAHPRHVVALGTLPMQDADLAVGELRRLKDELGLPGVQIGSHVNDVNLDDESLFPVFEAAQDLDMAILVHPWEMMGREHMARYWLPWLVGMPAELSRAICSLIFGGVFERLPRLRFAFAHGGGAFPWTIGRIEHGFRMRPDLVAVDNDVNPREYLGRFWVDSVTHDPAALRYLIDVVGARSVMLGTDYPFPLGEQRPGSAVEALDLDDETRAAVYHENALRWLGLDEARFR